MSKVTAAMGRPPKTAHILLVEDNPGDIYLLEKALQHHLIDYQLIRYGDGEQAISALNKDDCAVPDLILLDLNLPRREGFEVLQAVRGKPALSGVPVGILTTSDTAKDRHRAALIGTARYLHKPPRLEEFIDQVGRAIKELLNQPPGGEKWGD